ncbi:MAG: 3-dehydro-L-gulonate 2-dehydrogenase [Bacteroidales bacterium]|nr:3-dehydro-L-gulonate 2-dehydrogenase [Bacteroidales bacterium]
MVLVQGELMRSEFRRILIRNGFTEEKADICAGIFMMNTLDGISSHGVNRFPRFVEYITKGIVNPDAEPSLISSSAAVEHWDGNLGPGPLNALKATQRATELASLHGIGMVTLRHTNHWMRGGTYGWNAAGKGFAFLGWTNTMANMPAWGAKDCRIGNNPLVFAMPFREEAIVLDFAMSQYSYGKLEVYKLAGEKLPYPGGFDSHGNLTDDPSEILLTWRALPIGYWKGSGLSLMLDIFAASLSGGLSTSEISQKDAECSLSQVFIAISMKSLPVGRDFQETINNIITDLKKSDPVVPGNEPRYPGENTVRLRNKNLSEGIPVNEEVWDYILSL